MSSTLTIFCYHRVLPDEARDTWGRAYFQRGTAVGEKAFATQIRGIEQRFEVLSEASVLAWLAGERELARPACWLTFDDGYRDVADRVAPLLLDRGLPATVFVSTGVLDNPGQLLPADRWYAVLGAATRSSGILQLDPGGEPWAFDLRRDYARFVDGAERRRYLASDANEQARILSLLEEGLGARPRPTNALYLGGDDLVALKRHGWSVGGHGHTHAILTKTDGPQLEAEVSIPRTRLRALGLEPSAFAYPDGAYDARVLAATRDAGWNIAVTLGGSRVSRADDRFELRRFLPTS